MFNLSGKVAVISGASKGLGFAMTKALAQNGADIVALGLSDMDAIRTEVEQLGHKFVAILADLSRAETIETVAQKAIDAFGRVDILLNNAGITPVYPAEDYPIDAFDKAMTVNVKSLFLLTQVIGRHMVANKQGRIINTASVQSIKGGMNVAAYVATKHAVAGLTRALANEWGKHGVTVNAIAPGYMVTDNTAKLRTQAEAVKAITSQIPLGRWGRPEDLMAPIVFLASDEAAYVNGHLLVVDGGHLNN